MPGPFSPELEGWRVELSKDQIRTYTTYGLQAAHGNRMRGWNLQSWRSDWGFDTSIKGCHAEGAWAVILGVKYVYEPLKHDHNTPRGDVAGWQVKSLDAKHKRNLIIQPKDGRQYPYVLAAFENYGAPIFVGWVWGHEVMNNGYWQLVDHARGIHSEGWWIPAEQLRPMNTHPGPWPKRLIP